MSVQFPRAVSRRLSSCFGVGFFFFLGDVLDLFREDSSEKEEEEEEEELL